MTDTDDDLPRSPGDVRQVYDEIAGHFSKTRANPWPEVTDFLERVDGGAIGLDVGCGNGRHCGPLAERTDTVLGLDLSPGLLAAADERLDGEGVDATLIRGDAAALPVSTGSVDVCLSIATVHHLPDRGTRVESLQEIGRVLKAGGRALVSAWATAHERFDAESGATEGFDTTVDWTLPDGETRPRFYHVYAPAEFEADLESAGLTVADSYVSSGNCYAEVGP